MEPTGAARPVAYFIGEAPGADEDRKGKQFIGPAGRILRGRVPEEWAGKIRWNNCVRTRPPKDRAPSRVEIECCRPSIVRDIKASRPAALVGFGNVPLGWAGIADAGIMLWSGRRVPVLIGERPYWFFPVIHPSAVQRDPRWREGRATSGYKSELEFQFALHLRRALDAIKAGLPEPRVHAPAEAAAEIAWVDGSGGASDLERVVAHLRAAVRRPVAGFDYETSTLRPYGEGAKILTAAVSTHEDGTLAFPFDHRESRWSPVHRRAIDAAWSEFLHYRGKCRRVSHHLTFEMEWSAFFYGKGLLHAGRWGCSVAQAYVLDERPGAHNLEFLCIQYFGINIKKLAGVQRNALDAEPLDRVLRYNGLDAKYHRLLYAAQSRALRDAGLASLYAEHLERVPAAVLTQLRGVPVSQRAVRRLAKKYTTRMREAEAELRALPAVRKVERARGKVFRPSANDDVMAVCRSLGYHPDSVDETALEGLDHPFGRAEVQWRKAAKVFGTYVLPVADAATRARLGIDLTDAEPPRVAPDGLLHPQTNVSRVRTSRTSSDDPNYQNWPKRGASDAIEVRGMIEPLDPDEVIVSFDYGQIQARNVGMESLDRALLDAFWNDYDIHFDFMEHLARLYPRWVKEGARELARDKALVKKYRNDVKHGFVFASFFGAGANKTSGVLGIPLHVGEQLGEIFWGRFGGIKKWHTRLERDYYRTGYVTGHAGYRRRAPVSYNERINSPIQADEAKIVLDAMIRLSRRDPELLAPSMEIHDDLTFVWPRRKVDELAEIVVREMLTVPFAWAQTTPIVVEMSVGDNWAALKEPGKAGYARFDAGVFSSHKYDGIDMPKSCPI
jgi:uracil-DNA glycosylase family 4